MTSAASPPVQATASPAVRMSSSSRRADPQRIVCVGINYRSPCGGDRPGHFAGAERCFYASPICSWPRRRTGAPKVSDKFDFEGELAVVIGRPAAMFPPADALKYVAGTPARRRQRARLSEVFRAGGKNFPATGPLGPVLAIHPPREIPTRPS